MYVCIHTHTHTHTHARTYCNIASMLYSPNIHSVKLSPFSLLVKKIVPIMPTQLREIKYSQ